MDNGTLTLSFSETIDVASIQPGLLTLQAAANVTLGFSSNSSGSMMVGAGDELAVQLGAGAQVEAVAGSLTAARVVLPTADVNRIKARHLLCTSAETTFLALGAGAAQDTAGNAVVALGRDAALGLAATAGEGSVYVADATAPRLVAFDLSMDAGRVVLDFDEPVLGGAVNGSSLVLQSGNSSGQAMMEEHRLVSARVVDGDNATRVTLELSVEDVNAVKRVRGLASGAGTTYARWGRGLAQDMVGLGVVGVGADDALEVRQYEGDGRAPVVVSALVNMTSEELVVGFDEPVDASTLQIGGKVVFASVQAGPANSSGGSGVYGPEAYVLSGGSIVGGAGSGAYGQLEVRISLAVDDVLALKVNRLLLGVGPRAGLSAGEAIVAVQLRDSTVRDMAGNAIAASARNVTLTTDSTAAVPVAGEYLFYPDTVPPRVTAVVIDVNASRVVLNFDEPVNASGLAVGELEALGGAGVSGVAGLSHALTTGGTRSMDGTQVVVGVGEADLHAIQLLVGVWSNASTAWVGVGAGLIADMAGNAVVAGDVAASEYIGDGVRPRIVSFEVDMDAGLVRVNVSEPVAVASVNASAIVLQRAAVVLGTNGTGAGAGANVTSEWGNAYLQRLSVNTSVVTTTNGLSFVLELVRGDLDALKVKGIGSSVSTAWLTASADLVVDMAGRRVRAAVNGESAVQASAVVGDGTAPALERVGLDMDRGVFELVFSETVDSSTLRVGELVVQGRRAAVGSLGGHEVHVLGGAGTRVVSLDGPVQVIELGKADLDALKAGYGVALSAGTTFVSFGAGLVRDRAGNAVVSVSGGSAVQAAAFVADGTAPELVSFAVSLVGAADGSAVSTGALGGEARTMALNLTFSEPVAVWSVNVTSLVLYPTVTGAGGAGAYRLSGAVSVVDAGSSTRNGTEVRVVVGRSDTNAVKALAGLCVSAGTCVLGYGADLVRDMAGNAVVGRGAGGSGLLVPAVYVGDDVGPVLEGASLDMDAGVLELVFSETVDVGRVAAGRVRLYGSACGSAARYNVSGAEAVYGLAGAVGGGSREATAGASAAVRVNLTEGDLNAIRDVAGLARGVGSTYVGLGLGGAFDMSGNAAAVSGECGLGAVGLSAYVGDATRPELESFVLDMDSHLLLLTFSETINQSSFDPASLSFSGFPNVPLGSSAVMRTSLLTARLNLSTSAVRELETAYQLCSSTMPSMASPCTLSVAPSFAFDGFGNAIAASDVVASLVIVDTRSPRLLSFDADMTQHKLMLTFSEVVRISSVNTSTATLLNSDGSFVRLGADTVVVSATNGTVLELLIGGRDLEALQLDAGLAVSAGTTQLSLEAGFVVDMAGNALSPRGAFGVSSFVADTIAPTLASWQLNMNIGLVTLVFSEVVNVSSVDVLGIGLQDNALAYRESGMALAATLLTGGTVLSGNNATVQVLMSAEDMNLLKRLDGVATRADNSYLTLAPGMVRDMVGNPISGILDGSGVRADAFVDDTTAPEMTGFDLEQDAVGYPLKLLLRFSETVDVTTLDLTKLVLQESAVAGSDVEEKRLTGGTATPLQ